jgi:hypothetical protein
MNKVLHIPIDIKLNRYPTQIGLNVFVHEEALQELCLALCLLAEGLISLLVVGDLRREKILNLSLRGEPDNSKARISFNADTSLVELTPTGLKYMQHFFLKYYRDGVAEVDHIDIEAIETGAENSDAYLTMRVGSSKPSVSPEEAKQRLRGLS